MLLALAFETLIGIGYIVCMWAVILVAFAAGVRWWRRTSRRSNMRTRHD